MNPALAQSCLRAALTAPVYDVAERTPLQDAPQLSARLGAKVMLKREDLQPIFSFKLRGAYALMASLPVADIATGVVAASAGNHAQGVALAARQLGVPATIVMPRTTPRIKVEAVERLGADIQLVGDSYDVSCVHAKAFATDTGKVFIHPFDDDTVIAGQGTVGVEIVQQLRAPPRAIFVPVGGGGLAAGLAACVKALCPETEIIGVEPEDAACLAAALREGRPTTLPHVGIFADGTAVREIGKRTFDYCREFVDRVITVDTDQICAAIRDIFVETRAVVEPSGALAVAGVEALAGEFAPEDVLVAINSGANINFDRLAHVVERAELGAGREALLAATIPERPGAFLDFIRRLGYHAITEFNYRYAAQNGAQVFVGMRIAGTPDETDRVIDRLDDAGYAVQDLSHNELAKLHVRHMVGGRPPQPTREALYRFEFPERPGALLDFLTVLAGRWNISLFHYRNHGSAYGRVLAGFMVPEEEDADFASFLDATGYHWTCESENPAYQAFLAAAETPATA
ncbi:MAG: threonine ammonia-lyase, biosynthetic [Pseudomonadota bacterium]